MFFDCLFSSFIWKKLSNGILQNSYSANWNALKIIIVDKSLDAKALFCVRYAMQCEIHNMWREHNRRRHGEAPPQHATFVKIVEKQIRNKLILVSVSKANKLGAEGVLAVWFGSREYFFFSVGEL